jgi:hypothetical protein
LRVFWHVSSSSISIVSILIYRALTFENCCHQKEGDGEGERESGEGGGEARQRRMWRAIREKKTKKRDVCRRGGSRYVYMCVCIDTLIHTYIYTHTHTRTHTQYTQEQAAAVTGMWETASASASFSRHALQGLQGLQGLQDASNGGGGSGAGVGSGRGWRASEEDFFFSKFNFAGGTPSAVDSSLSFDSALSFAAPRDAARVEEHVLGHRRRGDAAVRREGRRMADVCLVQVQTFCMYVCVYVC